MKGLVTPVFTPVNEKGELNLDVIPEYAQCQKYDQMDGVLGAYYKIEINTNVAFFKGLDTVNSNKLIAR